MTTEPAGLKGADLLLGPLDFRDNEFHQYGCIEAEPHATTVAQPPATKRPQRTRHRRTTRSRQRCTHAAVHAYLLSSQWISCSGGGTNTALDGRASIPPSLPNRSLRAGNGCAPIQ